MATEYINPQWRLPNEKTGNNQSYSMDFDGSNYIDLGTTLKSYYENVSAVSFSVWVSFKDLSTDVDVLGTWRSSFRMLDIRFLQSTGKLSFRVGNGADTAGEVEVVSSGKIVANTWYHLAMVYDGTQSGNADRLKAYINGSQETLTFTGVIPSTTSNLLNYDFEIGGNRLSENGSKCIDDVAIFDYALPATGSNSVATLYGSGTPFNPMALASPPIAYYPLGNSAHMGSNYLTPNGALQDYVFNFPTSIDAVQSDFTLFNGASEACISAWFKTSTQQSSKCLFSSPFSTGGNRFDLYLQTNGFTSYLKLGAASATNISSSIINYYDDKWHNVIVTYDGVNHKIYYDGIEVATAARSGALANSTYNKLEIGRYGTSYSNNVVAEISNVLVWTKGLTSTDAETLYNYGSPIRTLANIPQNSNLKAWYKLDASEIYNSTSTEWEINQASSFWKNSIDFNLTYSSANKAYIQCANTTNLNLTGAMTLSAWMKGDQLGGSNYNGLGTQGGGASRGYGLLRGPNNAVFSISDNGSSHRYVLSPANTWLDGWNHVVGVFDPNSRFEVYVNGVFSASGTNYAQQTSTNPFQIGNRGDGSYYYNWLGQLSNVSIWNTALSNGGSSVGSVAGGEIATLYNGGEPLQDLLTGPQNSNLLSWWKLDNIATGIQDSKGTNNGTIVTLGDGSVTSFDHSVSTLNGLSSGMSQSNLVQSDLLTTSSYSPYAMNFTGNASVLSNYRLPTGDTAKSISVWVKADSLAYSSIVSAGTQATGQYFGIWWVNASDGFKFVSYGGDASFGFSPVVNTWYHLVVSYAGSGALSLYYNGILGNSTNVSARNTGSSHFNISGIQSTQSYWDGDVSNVSVYNYALSTNQVKEIYNEGRPSNLNNFSGTAPAAWWQLGSNSSYASGWTCLDEIGSNNGTSQNMLQNAIVDGVGTSGNGTSTNMTFSNITYQDLLQMVKEIL